MWNERKTFPMTKHTKQNQSIVLARSSGHWENNMHLEQHRIIAVHSKVIAMLLNVDIYFQNIHHKDLVQYRLYAGIRSCPQCLMLHSCVISALFILWICCILKYNRLLYFPWPASFTMYEHLSNRVFDGRGCCFVYRGKENQAILGWTKALDPSRALQLNSSNHSF